MRKTYFLFSSLFLFLFPSCESELDKDISNKVPKGKITFSVDESRGLETRSATKGLFANIGSFVSYDEIIEGVDRYTVSSNGSVIEPPQYRNSTSLHTFYYYMPYEASTSLDPTKVTVRPLPKIQTQIGTSSSHLSEYSFYVGIPFSSYPFSNLHFTLFSALPTLEIRINTNIEDLKVNRIQITAPQGKIVTFDSGTVDITKRRNTPGFGEVTNITGASNTVGLDIVGNLPIPNSETEQASAYLTINPFNAYGEKLTIDIYSNMHTAPYTFEVDADMYIASLHHSIDLRIEKLFRQIQ